MASVAVLVLVSCVVSPGCRSRVFTRMIKRSNQAMQRTASQPAITLLRVSAVHSLAASRAYTGLAVVILFSLDPMFPRAAVVILVSWLVPLPRSQSSVCPYEAYGDVAACGRVANDTVFYRTQLEAFRRINGSFPSTSGIAGAGRAADRFATSDWLIGLCVRPWGPYVFFARSKTA